MVGCPVLAQFGVVLTAVPAFAAAPMRAPDCRNHAGKCGAVCATGPYVWQAGTRRQTLAPVPDTDPLDMTLLLEDTAGIAGTGLFFLTCEVSQ